MGGWVVESKLSDWFKLKPNNIFKLPLLAKMPGLPLISTKKVVYMDQTQVSAVFSVFLHHPLFPPKIQRISNIYKGFFPLFQFQ